VKEYNLSLNEQEIRYLLLLIAEAEELLMIAGRAKHGLYQPDSQLRNKVLDLVSENVNLQTYFSKPFEYASPKWKYTSSPKRYFGRTVPKV
jgi:hypothetical protein